jgi:hypothetical protein
LVIKYVARASVAVPFIIALGFALAAITVMLVERFGHVTGYWLVAAGLVAIGIVAAITVSVKVHEEDVAEQQAEQSDTEEVVSDATAQAMMQAPIALLGAAFTMPGGATAALNVARILGRNYPLVLFAGSDRCPNLADREQGRGAGGRGGAEAQWFPARRDHALSLPA